MGFSRRPAPAAWGFEFLTLISLVRVRCSAWDKYFWAFEGLCRAEHFEQATLIDLAPIWSVPPRLERLGLTGLRHARYTLI